MTENLLEANAELLLAGKPSEQSLGHPQSWGTGSQDGG